jgi:penicillin-binding protein 1A
VSSFSGFKRRLLQLLLALVAAGALGGTLTMGVFYWYIVRPLPVIDSLQDYEPKLITRILARDGSLIRALAEERRVVVPIEQIPDDVKNAFVASEDSSFYEHDGLDYKGIVRALWTNIKAGGISQGGSTITQQVAKTFLLSSDRTVVRKLKDMVLALRIEKRLQKNEILYLYLNQIYLGSGAYGVEMAAQTYFGKHVGELSLAEIAMIVGVVPAPNRYSPLRHMDSAKKRQQLVLGRMLEEGYITNEQHEIARKEEVRVLARQVEQTEIAGQYFAEEVRRYLEKHYGAQKMLTGGLEVRTSVDLAKQSAGYRAVRRGLREHDRRLGYRGPIREVLPADWKSTLEEIAAEKNVATPGELPRVKALVTRVDDEKERVELALGPDRSVALELADVSWARPADPQKDGVITWVTKVGQALKEGWLVWLEQQPGQDGAPRYALYQEPDAQGALLAYDVETGYVDAMIGGYDFDDSQFNRAVQAKRQPGSSFKPIIYSEALRHGYTLATIVYDTPMVFTDDLGNTWKPKNYSYRFDGPITLRDALARSRNIATVKILQDIGIPAVLQRAGALGIQEELEPNLSLALGSSEVTMLEMVRAYSAFASGGRIIEPIFILEIKDRNGEVLESNVKLAQSAQAPVAADAVQPEPAELVQEIKAEVDREDDPDALPVGYGLDPVTSFLITDMLRAVVEEGTGQRAKELGRPIAGKTGTTNDLYDAWFIGFTPATVTGVWIGYDNVRGLGKNETGSRAATPVFVDYMKDALKDQPLRDFVAPTGIEFARVDKGTGLRSVDPAATFMPFAQGTAPAEFAESPTNGIPARPPRLD